ncbi:hypothetical protein OHB12_08500 [Nocardia sp. NBC_01730]|uniref:hypothetical protein n=1 Tax=Nocardia sp. NBC_01730 TaxID=2975998 RepID=UPI002E1155DD|nr:hypothetical protein OHB12_08500 [Nocardia sp. NBC_01730]
MAHKTPWQVNDARSRRNQDSDRLTPGAPPREVDRGSNWGYLFAAVGSVVTFILLFQPWLTASGSGGQVSADAFGRVNGVTSSGVDDSASYGDWGVSSFGNMEITGVWGLLASGAMVTTVFAVIAHRRLRTEVLSFLIIGSSAAVALLVLIILMYLDAKGPELRSLTVQQEGFGSIMDRLLGASTASDTDSRRIASAGLTPAALIGGLTACGTAVAALAQGTRRYAANLLWRVAEPQPTTQPEAAVDAHPEQTPSEPESGQPLWEELIFDDDVVANVTWVRNPLASPLHETPERSAARTPMLIG